jgi:hypothetical protein
MTLCGIDPGISGAYAVLDGDRVLALDHLPVHKTQRGSTAKIRSELDLHALRDALLKHNVSHVIIESVTAMPRQITDAP